MAAAAVALKWTGGVRTSMVISLRVEPAKFGVSVSFSSMQVELESPLSVDACERRLQHQLAPYRKLITAPYAKRGLRLYGQIRGYSFTATMYPTASYLAASPWIDGTLNRDGSGTLIRGTVQDFYSRRH
jgi:hypothetical protein